MRLRECTLCGGSGRVGMFGAKGLGLFHSPCSNVAAASKSTTSTAAVPGGKEKKAHPFLAAPFWAAQPIVTRPPPAPPAQSASPDLAGEAPLQVPPKQLTEIPPEVPVTMEKSTPIVSRFTLQVQLADGSGRLEFETADNLPKLVDDFVSRHRLISAHFTAPLLERAERMVRTGSHEERVDIVDLL